jgi:hypothetical protein
MTRSLAVVVGGCVIGAAMGVAWGAPTSPRSAPCARIALVARCPVQGRLAGGQGLFSFFVPAGVPTAPAADTVSTNGSTPSCSATAQSGQAGQACSAGTGAGTGMTCSANSNSTGGAVCSARNGTSGAGGTSSSNECSSYSAAKKCSADANASSGTVQCSAKNADSSNTKAVCSVGKGFGSTSPATATSCSATNTPGTNAKALCSAFAIASAPAGSGPFCSVSVDSAKDAVCTNLPPGISNEPQRCSSFRLNGLPDPGGERCSTLSADGEGNITVQPGSVCRSR